MNDAVIPSPPLNEGSLSSAPPPGSTTGQHLTVSPQLVGRLAWFGDEGRRNGIHLVAGPGSGKSRALGRMLACLDLMRGFPQIILDPTGGTIDNFLDQLIGLPPALQEQCWPRVRYVDLGSTDAIVPLPLYYRLSPHDSLFVVANRPLEVFRRQDPHLETAGIEGRNALFESGISAGQMAAALGGQITEVASMLEAPRLWKERFRQAHQSYPELARALNYFASYAELSSEHKRRQAGSLKVKLLPFLDDPAMRATFSASRRGVDIGEVDRHGLTLLVDGRHEHDPVRRQFKMLWFFRLVTDYLKVRGMAGRRRPLGFLIDEITQLLGFHSGENAAMAEDLEELISVLARNYGCLLTIAHQSLIQIHSERIRAALMQMGTQIIGMIHNPDDRHFLARYFLHYDPYWTKKIMPVWMNLKSNAFSVSEPTIIDYRTEEFSLQEQEALLAQRFQSLDRFCFLVRSATAEGSFAHQLQEVTIAPFDANRYPDEEQLAEVRRQLRQRDGVPVATLLAEIEARQRALIAVQPARQKQVKTEDPRGILESAEQSRHAATQPNHLSDTSTQDLADPAGEIADPDSWKKDLWGGR